MCVFTDNCIENEILFDGLCDTNEYVLFAPETVPGLLFLRCVCVRGLLVICESL